MLYAVIYALLMREGIIQPALAGGFVFGAAGVLQLGW